MVMGWTRYHPAAWSMAKRMANISDDQGLDTQAIIDEIIKVRRI